MARLPRANYIQGSVAPVSGGGPTVPQKDPLLMQQISDSSALIKKIDALSSMAFKMAGETSKAEGTAFGAANAPTMEQIKGIYNTGRRIGGPFGEKHIKDQMKNVLPGDASSFNIWEKAAYAGSLAVTESRFTAGGRRALGETYAIAIRDSSMTPDLLQKRLDSVVTEYSDMMSSISSVSGAKVNASLASTANSNLNSYTRSWVTKEQKKTKNTGFANFTAIIDGMPETIIGHDDSRGVSLEAVIAAKREEAKSLLLNTGWTEATTNTKMKAFDKVVHSHLRSAIVNDVATEINSDNLDTLNNLSNNTAKRHIQKIYDSLNPTQQATVRSEIEGLYSAHRSAENYKQSQERLAIEKKAQGLMRIMISNSPESQEHQDALATLKIVDPLAAKTWRSVGVETGAFNDWKLIRGFELDIDNPAKDRAIQKQYTTDYKATHINSHLARLRNLYEDKKILSKEYNRLRTKIINRNQEDFSAAMLIAKEEFKYEPRSQLDLSDARVMKAKSNSDKAERLLTKIFGLNPEADLDAEIRKIIRDIKPIPETKDEIISRIAGVLGVTATDGAVRAKIQELKKNPRLNASMLLRLQPDINTLRSDHRWTVGK